MGKKEADDLNSPSNQEIAEKISPPHPLKNWEGKAGNKEFPRNIPPPDPINYPN